MKNYRLSLFLCVAGLFATHATQVRLLNLEDMVKQSDRIVVGTVKSIDAEKSASPQSSLPVVRISLELTETLKGMAQSKTVLRTLSSNIPLRMKMMFHSPQFKVGEEVMVFLDKPTVEGLSGPLAFEQGVFRIARTKLGSKTIKNKFEPQRLFQNLKSQSVRAHVEGQKLETKNLQHHLTYDELKSTILKINQEKK